jgi:flagellar protein FliJ
MPHDLTPLHPLPPDPVMNPLAPLQALLAQTERERDIALIDSQRAAAEHADAVRQQEQLLTYRREYEQRWGAQFRNRATVDVLQCYQGFVARLGMAVEQQGRTVAEAQARSERERVRLQEHELRVASVRKLIERRISDIQRGIDRQDQKQTDEFAARAGWSRSQASGASVAERAVA